MGKLITATWRYLWTNIFLSIGVAEQQRTGIHKRDVDIGVLSPGYRGRKMLDARYGNTWRKRQAQLRRIEPKGDKNDTEGHE